MVAWTGIVGERKLVVSYKHLLTTNGTKCSTFQEAAGLSKSGDLINEVLHNVASVMNFNEEDLQERILRKKERINKITSYM
ncbi:hypothetical protein TNCV_3730791 [Trichonephila clavipes]|nr:hypothetical protein TNCV_3730791 [Trichonephila clavipes]